MNAPVNATQLNALPAPLPHADSQPAFLFTSAHRSLRASGVFAQITTPAAGGERSDSLFQYAVADAMNRARRAGVNKPIVMGAIPFDVTQPSCLYVPQQYEFFERSTVQGTPLGPVATVLATHSTPDEAGFKAAVRQAIVNFEHSPLRKSVLSRVLELQLAKPVRVERVLANLIAQNPSGFHFRVPLADGSELIGASPELLLRKVDDQIFSNPLAGSAKRQSNADEDRRVSATLLHSSKDHYEHRLVIDEIRRVLAPNCRALTVPNTPSLMATAAMWHLSTAIDGELHDPTASVLRLACELHPTPAVCGSPTPLARKLISLVEPYERGLFTGMVGWCDGDGNGEWVVTIRCGTVKQDRIRLFAGAGIVADSNPESEWLETQAKLGTMLAAFGLNHVDKREVDPA